MKSRKFRIILVLLGLPLIGVLAAAGYFLHWQHATERELRDLMLALDRDEPGWQLDDIDLKRLDIPVAENSAPLIRKLHAKVPKALRDAAGEEVTWHDLPPGQPLDAKQAATLAKRMAQVADLLPELRRFADRPRGAFTIRWSPDIVGVLVPHLQEARDLAQLLLDDAYLQTERGNFTGAIESCRATVGMAHAMDEEPLFISQLVRIACQHHAIDGVQHTLAGGEPSVAALAALQRALMDAERPDGFMVGLRGERACMHVLMSNLANGTLPASAFIGFRAKTPDRFADQIDTWALMASVPTSHIYLLRHHTEALAIARLPAAEQHEKLVALDADVKSAPGVAALMAAGAHKVHEGFRRQKSRLRCAVVALALERYRRAHGQWPADLAGLMPDYLKAVPIDPYNGEPIQYARRGNGVVVYCVGPDGKHNGTFRDGPQPEAGDPRAVETYYEFRLWDPNLRGLPLAERVAKKN
jgi:hypothetical protein